MNNFSPVTEAKQIIRLSHYGLKRPIHGPVCGISAEEITDTLADITESTVFKRHIIGGSGDIVAYSQPSVFPGSPPMVAPGIKKRLINRIARIKTRLHYTKTIGNSHEVREYRINGF